MFRALCVMLLVAASYAADASVIDTTSSNGLVQGARKLNLAASKPKSPSKKVSPKKSPSKKVSPKKSPSKKVSPKKSPAKGSPKKSPPKGSPKKSPGLGGIGGKHVISVGTGGGFSFSPANANVKVGDTVVFKAVSLGHNVMFTKGPSGVDLTKLSNAAMLNSPVGYSYSIKIPAAGTYSYMCGPHAGAGMVGTITAK